MYHSNQLFLLYCSVKCFIIYENTGRTKSSGLHIVNMSRCISFIILDADLSLFLVHSNLPSTSVIQVDRLFRVTTV